MRIHVTYAGGTIGMVDSPEGLRPGADLPAWLEQQVSGIGLAGSISLTQMDPLIDSSDTHPGHWQQIIEDIRAHSEQADAFIVLHGTDTMAYTSAALSYALCDSERPVVLTGSQYPLGVVGSDASANVTGALRAACSGQARGVSLFFGHRLLAGNRATKTSSWSFAGFDSPATAPLALTGAPWQWRSAPTRGAGWANPLPYGRHDVLIIDVAPGMTAARLEALLSPLPEAVIIRAYGVGNIPAHEPGFVDVLASVAAQGIPLVASSQCYQAEVLLGHYRNGNVLADIGAVSSCDMTMEATYAKLVFLLSQGLRGHELADWVGRSLAGELREVQDDILMPELR